MDLDYDTTIYLVTVRDNSPGKTFLYASSSQAQKLVEMARRRGWEYLEEQMPLAQVQTVYPIYIALDWEVDQEGKLLTQTEVWKSLEKARERQEELIEGEHQTLLYPILAERISNKGQVKDLH